MPKKPDKIPVVSYKDVMTGNLRGHRIEEIKIVEIPEPLRCPICGLPR